MPADFTLTMLVEADLPDDAALLRAMLVAGRGEIVQHRALITDLEGAGTDARAAIERLNAIITAFQRYRFGARSEQLHPDQLALALEELDAAVAPCACRGGRGRQQDCGTPRTQQQSRPSARPSRAHRAGRRH